MNLLGHSIFFRIFFVFTLLYMFNTAHAGRPHIAHVGLDFNGSPASWFVDYLEDVGINVKNISKEEVEFLTKALNEPAILVDLSRGGLFKSESYRNLFFKYFYFPKDGDSLFAKLFYEDMGEGVLDELPFDEAKRNWESLINALEQTTLAGHTNIEETDMTAAAISFIRRNSYKLYLNRLDTIYVRRITANSWREALAIRRDLNNMVRSTLENPAPEGSLFYIFEDLYPFNTSTYFKYYISPYFQLSGNDPYHFAIVREILKDPSILHTKKSILKIWTDINYNYSEDIIGINKTLFSKRIADSLATNVYINGSVRISIEGDSFLMAISAAAREDYELSTLFNQEYREVLDFETTKIEYGL